MNKTKVDWADVTWSPVTGCTPVSAGCAHCYAKRVVERFPACHVPGVPFGEVHMHGDRLDDPVRTRKPKLVFVCPMSDLFHEQVPDAFIRDVFRAMQHASQHTFILLTKRAKRMRDVVNQHFPRPDYHPNIILGVSVEDQWAAKNRVPFLLDTPAPRRVISVEPMLGAVQLDHIDVGDIHEDWCQVDALTGRHTDMARPCKPVPHVDWVIAGCESADGGNGGRPMDIEWVRSLRDQCVRAGTPFFLKQMVDSAVRPNRMSIVHMPYLDGVQWAQYPVGVTRGA